MTPEERDDAADALIRETLGRGHPFVLRARGGSMGAAIPDGTLLELVPVATAPTLGAVAAAILEDGLTIHRVVGVRADGARLFKGDANHYLDGWLAPADFIGVVARIERAGAWVPVSARALPAPTPTLRGWLGARWRRRFG